MKIRHCLCISLLLLFSCSDLKKDTSQNIGTKPFILIVQPIAVQSDEGLDAAPVFLDEQLFNLGNSKAEVDILFLEPVYYNNTRARDGLINLDKFAREAINDGFKYGQKDIVNMFFVNKIYDQKGAVARRIMDGELIFIASGESNPNLSITDYQVEITQNSPLVHPRIDLLSRERGRKAILDESYEPYFSKLQKREIAAFTGKNIPYKDLEGARAFAREKFISAVSDFNDKEKECISIVVKQINKTLLDNGITLMAKHPWRFIKVEDWLCGGFAHTRGTYIILSQRHIDHFLKNWNVSISKEEKDIIIRRFGGLLVHEQMHSLQRTFKSKFVPLYTENWDFKNARIQEEPSIVINQVSNPDAPLPEWLIPNISKENSFYWIRTLLKEGNKIPLMGKDFQDVVFIVDLKDGVYKVRRDKSDKIISYDISEIKNFANSFPVTRGIDHPNEISAYMFSEYFQSLMEVNTPFENALPEASGNINAFIHWINMEMKVL